MKADAEILNSLVAWAEADIYGQGVLMHLTINRPCPLCEGTTFCPAGCPMAACELDYEKPEHRREQQPIREYEYRRSEDGEWEQVLTRGHECESCSIYGLCMSCFDGREQRTAWKQGCTYLIDSVPLYSTPGYELTDPIRISAARVQKEVALRREGQLDLLGAAT